jgi:hypothetical protein
MRLESYQRGVLDLLKHRGGERPSDPYLRRVKASPNLALMRSIALWWRTLGIEAQCVVSARLLRRLGCFNQAVASFFDSQATSPFFEELAEAFLLSLAGHENVLIRSVARFERAYIRAQAEDEATPVEILWDRNPNTLFAALDQGGELPPLDSGSVYRMTVDRRLPGMVVCTHESA